MPEVFVKRTTAGGTVTDFGEFVIVTAERRGDFELALVAHSASQHTLNFFPVGDEAHDRLPCLGCC